jgi:hypothetical protein
MQTRPCGKLARRKTALPDFRANFAVKWGELRHLGVSGQPIGNLEGGLFTAIPRKPNDKCLRNQAAVSIP